MGFNYTTVANSGYNVIDKDGNHYAVYDGVNVMKFQIVTCDYSVSVDDVCSLLRLRL